MRRKSRKFISFAAAAFFALIGIACPAFAASDVTRADLRATAHALGFLDSLPQDGAIDIGVVYAPQSADSKAEAGQIAGLLNSEPGPNKSAFHARIVAVDNLAQSGDHLDAVYIAPGLSGEAATIADALRRRHIVSISNDPACLDNNCCVLMVRDDHGVQIVLNTALADAVGANFSTVFTMMVKRR